MGEGDRRSRWRGRDWAQRLGLAPSTTLRAVPLPRYAGEEKGAKLWPAALLAGWLAASPAAAAGLTEAQARDFAARQERAWNSRDLTGFFALFTPDAVFIDQTRTPKGEMIPYGQSDRAKALAQARKFLAGSTSVERGVIDKVTIAPDGRSAVVAGREITTVKTGGRTRKVCADTQQTLVLSGGTIRSKGQTDTVTRCR